MKNRFGYIMQLLALALMISSGYSASGQNPFGERLPTRTEEEPRARPLQFNPLFNHGLSITENSDPNAKTLRKSEENLAVVKAKLTEAISLKDEKIITDVKGEVKNALNEHFAHDLAVRESELARLTKRADNAESQNKQRRSSRNELIDLQLQSFLLENETAGIGSNDLERQRLTDLGRIDNAQGISFFSAPKSVSTPPPATPPATKRPLVGSVRSASNPNVEEPTTFSGLRAEPKPGDMHRFKALIEAASKKLAGSASEDEVTQATQELKDALGEYFDRDLEERDGLLKSVRSDLEMMKQKLEKRASSKDSIVELQFKLFVNEASGLGFFGPRSSVSPRR